MSVLALLVTAGLVAGAYSAPVALLLLLVIVIPYLVVTLRRGGPAHGGARHVERGALVRPIALTVPAVAADRRGRDRDGEGRARPRPTTGTSRRRSPASSSWR